LKEIVLRKKKRLLGEKKDDYYFYLHLIYPLDLNLPTPEENKLEFYPEIDILKWSRGKGHGRSYLLRT
jgi:hypothetical protein